MKKILRSMLCAGLAFGLAACGGSSSGTSTGDGGSTAATKEIKFNDGFDPDNFDPQAANTSETAYYSIQMYDGLYRQNLSGEYEPSLAESYTMSDDGLTYTFKLRDGLKFQDGSPLTTEDVIYSWERALDPANAFEYAYQLYYIKNGAAYNSGEASVDDLGLKAVDDTTLEVTLENPTPYFISLTAFPTYYVISKEFAEKQATYGANVDSSLASGPFKVTEWNKGQYVTFEKNENYWDADSVSIDKLTFYCVSDSSTELTMYDTGDLDVTHISMSAADIQRLTASGELKTAPQLSTRYIMVNNTREALSDARVRQALELALDRDQLAVNVVTNSEASCGFVPNGMSAVDDKTQEFAKGCQLSPTTGDVEKAKQLLADAGYPNGEGFPDLSVVYTTNEANRALAEAIVEMWSKNLGIKVKAENLEGTVRRDRKQTGDFDMSLDGWAADYDDPFTFIELMETDNAYNNGKYSNPEVDKYVETARSSLEQSDREAAMEAAEKLYLEDMGSIPLYTATSVYLQKDNVSDVIRSELGMIDFKWAKVE